MADSLTLNHDHALNLRRMATIVYAASFWDDPAIKEKRFTPFTFNWEGGRREYEFEKVTNLVLKNIDKVGLPFRIRDDVINTAKNLRNKIYDHMVYFTRHLKLVDQYANEIYWTNCGTIDVIKVKNKIKSQINCLKICKKYFEKGAVYWAEKITDWLCESGNKKIKIKVDWLGIFIEQVRNYVGKQTNELLKWLCESSNEKEMIKRRIHCLVVCENYIPNNDVYRAQNILNWLCDSEDKKNIIKNQIDCLKICRAYAFKADISGAEEMLDWLCESKHEKKMIKRQINCFKICRKYVYKDIDLAKSILNWLCESEDEEKMIKSRFNCLAVCSKLLQKDRICQAQAVLNWLCESQDERKKIKSRFNYLIIHNLKYYDINRTMEALNWLCESEKKTIRNQIDFLKIWRMRVENRDISRAEEILNLFCESEDERKIIKTQFDCLEICKHLLEEDRVCEAKGVSKWLWKSEDRGGKVEVELIDCPQICRRYFKKYDINKSIKIIEWLSDNEFERMKLKQILIVKKFGKTVNRIMRICRLIIVINQLSVSEDEKKSIKSRIKSQIETVIETVESDQSDEYVLKHVCESPDYVLSKQIKLKGEKKITKSVKFTGFFNSVKDAISVIFQKQS